MRSAWRSATRNTSRLVRLAWSRASTSTRLSQGTVLTSVEENVYSTTPDTMFRWDPSAQQWIFNINNKSYPSNQTYFFRISLNDGTTINFNYGLK